MEISDAMADFFKRHRSGQTQRQFGFGGARNFAAERGSAATAIEPPPQQPITEVPAEKRRFLQIHDSFIVAETDDGFVIIDQHALHERVMYDNLHGRITNGNLESQKLLMPQSFELSDAQAALIEENADLIKKLGLELTPFGPRTMAVQAFPSLLAKADPLDFMQDLIDLLEKQDTGPDPQTLLDAVLNMAACKAAIKAGQKLTDSEMEQLLLSRDTTESASRCPHGRPTTLMFSLADLEKQFKRT